MIFALCLALAAVFACGVFLVLRRDLIKIVIGLGLIGNAVNLGIFVVGGWKLGSVPIIPNGADSLDSSAIDPVPQALVLTAIVIGFGMQAFLLVLARLQDRNAGTTDTHELGDNSQ